MQNFILCQRNVIPLTQSYEELQQHLGPTWDQLNKIIEAGHIVVPWKDTTGKSIQVKVWVVSPGAIFQTYAHPNCVPLPVL
jgi:hypothetical protein